MKHRGYYFAGAAALVACAAVASAKSGSDPKKLLDAVVTCLDVTDSTSRLACYDHTVGALKAAREHDDKLFQPAPPPRQEFKEINSTAISVTPLEPGSWLLVLADHSVWRTADSMVFEPERGDTVHIVKGGFGGYVANIRGQRAVHVKPMR